jgi:hypothetical protein
LGTAAKVVGAKIAGTGASRFSTALAGAVDDKSIGLRGRAGWNGPSKTMSCILDYGAPLSQLAVKLTPDTGSIGSPEPATGRATCGV